MCAACPITRVSPHAGRGVLGGAAPGVVPEVAGRGWADVGARDGQLLEQIAAEHSWEIVAEEVMPDDAHLFVRVGPTDAPAQVVRAFEDTRHACCAKSARHLGAGSRRCCGHREYSPPRSAPSGSSTVRRYIEHRWDVVAALRRAYVFRLRPTARQHFALAAMWTGRRRALQRRIAGHQGWLVAQQDPHPLRRPVRAD